MRAKAFCAGVLGLVVYALPAWLTAPAQTIALPNSSYVDPQTCAVCHRGIWDTYRQTGMGRSFYRPSAETAGAATYFHEASDSYFSMVDRGGKFYQRRHQLDSRGQEVNVIEKQ